MRADAVLCLLDGSTSAPTSGDLARQIIRDVVDWCVATDEAAMAESLSRQLRRTPEAETIAAEGWKWIELPGCEAHRPVRQLSALSLGGIRPLAWTCAATRA